MTSITENRDCMDAMRSFPDKYFDLAIVDPPYGIKVNMNMGINSKDKKKHKQKSWDDSAPDDSYFSELFRTSKNQIIWGGNYFELGPTRCFLIWDKLSNLDQADCEFAWTSFSGSARVYRYARGNDSGFAPKLKDTERYFANIHPTQKPVALYKWILQNYAKQGDKILDTHLGSGSSRIAAYDMGFDFWGYELDAEYFEKQEQRFRAHVSKPVLFQPYEMYATGTLF